mgnify:CR=1 FL=1
MPFVPISDEELKSLNSLESKRFVPISNEELKALNSSLQLASQQPAKGVTRTTTKVSATSTGKLPVAEPYQVPLPDAMVSVSKGRNVASQLRSGFFREIYIFFWYKGRYISANKRISRK